MSEYMNKLRICENCIYLDKEEMRCNMDNSTVGLLYGCTKFSSKNINNDKGDKENE